MTNQSQLVRAWILTWLYDYADRENLADEDLEHMADDVHAMRFEETVIERPRPTLTEFLLARIAEDERDAPAFAHLYIGHETLEARILAECKAKRHVVEMAAAGVAAISEGRPHRSFRSGRVHQSAGILAALALPYADHADYRQVWKP